VVESERSDRYKQDTDSLYRAIGEFVVKFEHVCHALQTGIQFMLAHAGLHNQHISQIVLAGMTADPLRTFFESLVGETQHLNEAEKSILKDVLNRFQRLTTERNIIVHSTWFVGWGNESTTDYSEVEGIKFQKNRSGADFQVYRRKADEFDSLSREAEVLAGIFMRLHACFSGGWSVERNFIRSDDGHVSVPPGT
jgi:hypothetical protein